SSVNGTAARRRSVALYDLVRPARRKTWVSPVDRLRQAEDARERRVARGYAKEAKRTLKRERKEIERGGISPLYPSVWDYPIISSEAARQIHPGQWRYEGQAGSTGQWYY